MLVLLGLGFQPEWAHQVVESSEAQAVDPLVVAGIILSEHGGVLKEYSVTVANKHSKCIGLGQIAPFWAKHYGIKVSDLRDPLINIDITAKVIARSQARHARHARNSKHHWIAHYKCGTKNLDNCSGPVRRTLRYINDTKTIRSNFIKALTLLASNASPLVVLHPFMNSLQD